MVTIAIIVSPLDPYSRTPYILREIAKIWEEQGHSVVVATDPARPPPADIGILHVDLSVVPSVYNAMVGRYGCVINGRVVDISKRRISRQLLTSADGYGGPVIVKTNANSGGVGEFNHHLQRGLDIRKTLSAVTAYNYRIYDSAAQVPPALWNDPNFVVERFMPEHRGSDYVLRVWIFLGTQSTHSLVWSDRPIVKAANVRGREALDDPPEALQTLRVQLGFDYGKFDYVMHDGEPILLDANRTPTLPSAAEAYRPRAELLAAGLPEFL